MKSEFYVINLIRSDEEACRKVAESLGLAASLKAANVIYELSQTNTLWTFMMRHNCNWQDTFVEIRHLVDGELEATDTLKDEDLNLILEAKGQKLLGELLLCPPTEP